MFEWLIRVGDGTMIAAESQGMSEPRVIVFLKTPRPGFVKTRLAVAIGPEAACAAYRQMAGAVLEQLAPLPHVELRYTPDDAEAEISPWLKSGWTARPQGGGDLGERMHRACAEANGPAIIIGSDCPAIALADILDAATALKNHNVVVGPATDGGYWLIGLAAPCPALFVGIAWSTDDVLKVTLAKAEAAGLSVHQLRELADVDTVEDWERFLLSQK
jgi:rSAM/selenodomain-associated transferase 1